MDNKLKGLFLFAGIGACEKAFERLNTKYGFEMENTGFAEIDKYAIQSYCTLHNVDKSMNYGDVSKINPNDIADFDFMMWGFPCTDISRAGKQKGFTDENGDYTRSGMYYPALEILKAKKPKFSIIENVKALTDKTFEYELNTILEDLEKAGYRNYMKVLNAKDYGIPQNRERIFIVSIREDIQQGMLFPKGFDNGLRLKDLLEDDVDESYFLSDKIVKSFIKQKIGENIVGAVGNKEKRHQTDWVYNINGTCGCLKATEYKSPKLIEVGSLKGCGGPYDKLNEQPCRVYNPDGIAPTIHTCGGGNLEPKILTPKRTEYGKQIRKDYENGHIKESRHNMTQLEPREDGVSNTITTVLKDNILLENDRIRKLTERECWRLFGFADTDIDKVKSTGMSKSQMYKQAGNSIVIDVLEHILYELLIVKHPVNTLDMVQRQLTLF